MRSFTIPGEAHILPTAQYPNLLDEKQAAAILHCSVAFLRRNRRLGLEPAYCRLGRLVRYRPEDLAAFVSGRLVGGAR